jgi:flagellar protein FliS
MKEMMNQSIAYGMADPVPYPNPLQLTVMGYDAVIRDLNMAKHYHIEHAADAAFERNDHAQRLITELLLGLDYDQGGEIAGNLSKLYDFAIRQLVGIGVGTDPRIYDDLISIFGNLKEAWIQLDAQMS